MVIYAFGSNGSGQLGVGHTEDLSLPTRCLFEDDAKQNNENENENDEVVHIAAGGNHTLVLFASGAVYAAGSNAGGRCALSTSARQAEDTETVVRFRRVVISDDSTSSGNQDGKRCVSRFSAVSATWEASFLVDAETGAVCSVGAGAKGELGLGPNVTGSSVPVRIPDFPPPGTKVVSVSSSGWHTVAVLSNGDVYGWGSARKGQLGKASVQEKVCWSPTKIEDVGIPAKQVACGQEFTVVAGDPTAGSIIVLGSNKWNVQTAAPQSVKGYATVSAGWNGVTVHSSDGSVVSWGRNDRGQLPPPDTPLLSKLAIGSEHAVALTDAMELVACGWGEHGNCGPTTDAQGNVKGQWAMVPFDLSKGENIIKLGAGCATSWVVTS